MVVAIFDPNLTGSLKEPPPQRVIIANVLDHMACEGLLMNLDAVMNDVKHTERAGDLLRVVADAMETAIEILRGQLSASALFISPPGFLYWVGNLQKYVYNLGVQSSTNRLRYLCPKSTGRCYSPTWHTWRPFRRWCNRWSAMVTHS